MAGQPTENLPRPAAPGADVRAQAEEARRVRVVDNNDDLLDLDADVAAEPMQAALFRGHGCGVTVTTQHGPAATPPMPPTWVDQQQPLNPSPFGDEPRTPAAARPWATPGRHQQQPPRYFDPSAAGYHPSMPEAGVRVGQGYVQPPHAAGYRTPAVTLEPCRKKSDALKKFNGSINDFQMWRERIMDHLCRSNRYWRDLLEILQVWVTPITREWLVSQSNAGYSGW